MAHAHVVDPVKCKDKMTIKIIVLGAANVGKTSLMKRYSTGSFSPVRQASIGSDFMTKTIVLNDAQVLLQIWDTAGSERFHQGTIGSAFYRNAHGCLLVYDVTNPSSFGQLMKWREEIVDKIGADGAAQLPIVVVANKIDLRPPAVGTGLGAGAGAGTVAMVLGESNSGVVDGTGAAGGRAEGEGERSPSGHADNAEVVAWCRENYFGHVETSAKDDVGVAAAMNAIAALAIETLRGSSGGGAAGAGGNSGRTHSSSAVGRSTSAGSGMYDAPRLSIRLEDQYERPKSSECC